MKCPDLDILSRYQDGGLDEKTAREVQEHVAGCRECEERFRKLGKLGLFLRIGLGRSGKSPCLTAEEVGAYIAGRVSRERREGMETHLAGCQKCLHEVAVFYDMLHERREEGSPVPTREAMARFAQMRPAARRVTWVEWALTHRMRVAVGAAAAVLAALVLPTMMPTEPTTRTTETTTADGTGVRDGMTMLATLGDQGETLASDHVSLARFSRRMRLILLQTMEVAGSPSGEKMEMLKEDVSNSGLADSVATLSEEIKDSRVQRYLTDCRNVLARIATIGEDEGNDASKEMTALAEDIQHMNLSEMSRLMELEGGGALWQTASL